MRSTKAWVVLVGLAGVHDCGMALYHFVLPYQWNWKSGLGSGAADSVVWSLFALDFSWSLLLFLVGGLVLYAAKLGPAAGVFARRTIFIVGLFWMLHGVYTWINPLPMPASLAWLRHVLVAFPAVVVALHWLPLAIYRA